MKGLSIFIPAYNEEKIVESHIRKVCAFLKPIFGKQFEVVAVDDSSRDRTPLILEQLTKKLPNFRWIRFENGPSRRENLGVAMQTARYDLVGYIDLDLATPLPNLIQCVEAIDKKGYDIGIGSRRIEGSHVTRSIYRLVWSTVYHKTLSLLFNSHIHDYQCGSKVFKRTDLTPLLKEDVGYDRTFTRGWFWDAELLIAAEKRKLRILEIPVEWVEGEKSSFNLLRELKVIPYILKLALRTTKKSS